MTKARIKINAQIKPRPMFEIRYVKPYLRGSFPIIGFGANLYGVYICVHPFYLSLTIARKIEPSPLTKEEMRILEQDNS